jgi:hypothetical protein
MKGQARRHSRIVAIFALACAAVALASCRSDARGAAVTPAAGAYTTEAASSRVVCRLIADNADAAARTITGADGAQSVRVGDTSYWFFGDTVRTGPGGRQDVIQAGAATSRDFDGSDCVQMTFKASGGVAQPLFPRGSETTAWPDGILPLDDGTILFYMVRAVRTSPFAWYVGSVGIGRMAPGSIEGERLVDMLWDERSGFGSRVTGARSPVRVGDDVIVFLHTDAGGNFAAKAPLARITDASAYTYWDGKGWSAKPGDARTMWDEPAGALPADNGITVSYEPAIGKWLAVYNEALSRIEVRTADEPWGPWSAPVTWLDCRPLVGDAYPYCYSAEVHRELSGDPGTLYLTFSGQEPYDVSLIEVKLRRR